MEELVVNAGLKYWSEVNNGNYRWARFEAIQFPNELIVRVDVGATHNKGTEFEMKECCSRTRTFLAVDDRVVYLDTFHP